MNEFQWIVVKAQDPSKRPEAFNARQTRQKSKVALDVANGGKTRPTRRKSRTGVICGYFQYLEHAKEYLAETMTGEAADFTELDKWINKIKEAI